MNTSPVFAQTPPTNSRTAPYTVHSWSSDTNVKINGRTPKPGDPFDDKDTRYQLTFKTTCDFLIVINAKGELKSFVPSGFSSIGKNCAPITTFSSKEMANIREETAKNMEWISEKHVSEKHVVAKWNGNIKINGKMIEEGQVFYFPHSQYIITFEETFNYLLCRNTKNEVEIISPAQWATKISESKKCDQCNCCQPIMRNSLSIMGPTSALLTDSIIPVYTPSKSVNVKPSVPVRKP